MSPEELTKVLQSHHLWLTSGFKEGEKANLEGADLQGANLQNATLIWADFKNANLKGTNLERAQLKEASFNGADLQNSFLRSAKFKNACLVKANLEGAVLEEADLRNAYLSEAEFKNAVLTRANLQGADLRRARFDGAILRRTNLREADLQNANLENANCLLSSQLAGADVAGAKLPAAIAEFKGLETIAEATSNAQKLLVAMLGGCLYSWLTIGTTKDAALLTNSASSPLPIIGTALPIVGFYMVAPIVLLAMYFYFHLNMQRLWEALADLPAVFPDGRSLDKRADPWLLNGLVSAHFVRLRRERPALSRLQQLLSIVLAWWVVPVTLFAFWGRFLPRHDWFGTGLHIVLLAAAIGFGWMSYRLARATLRGAPREPFPRRKAWENRRIFWRRVWEDRRTLRRVAGISGTCVIGITLYYVSLGAIKGVPPDAYSANAGLIDTYVLDRATANLPPSDLRRLVPRVLREIGFSPFANLVEEDVSTKPATWTRKPEEYPLVKSARLAHADMKYAKAYEAFLANADLRDANLSNAKLGWADLSHAILSGANLSHANLRNANLSHAVLIGTDLSYAVLTDANLSYAVLTDANLSHADLRFVDLEEVKGLTKSQIMNAERDATTRLTNLPP
jgi:uncharacterized protein YjbI with pentapeptide repeats